MRGSLYWELWSTASKKANFGSKVDFFQLRLIWCGLVWEDERNKHKVKRTRLRRDIKSSWFGPGLSQIWVPMPHTKFRSKIDFFVLRLIRCRDAWKDERIKHEMKRAHLWQDIRPSYFGPGLRQNLTVSGKKGLGLTSYGLGFFGVVPGRPPTEAPPWPGYSIFVKWVIQIVGDPHHTGSCPALVSELFKNRLSPLASKQAKRKKWLFLFHL